jgi:hypothetical protein
MNARKQEIFLLLTILLFLASIIAYAAAPPTETVDTGDSGFLLDLFLGVVKAVAEKVFGFVGSIIAAQLNILLGAYKFMILWNPNPNDIKYIASQIIGLFVPVYVIALIVVGIYFIFVATDPASRARAKDTLMKLIFSMVIVTLSIEIYGVFLDVSLALSKAVLSDVYFDSGNAALGIFGTVAIASGNTIPIFFVLVLIVAGISVAIRHVMVYFMAVLFPLTIFLYFFDFTREAGSKLLRHTFMSIFTQVVQAFMLAVTIVAMNSAGGIGMSDTFSAFLCIFVALGGFTMLALAPLMMMGIMEWIGSTLAMAGSVLSFIPGGQVYGAILTAAGSIAAGMGPGGLIAGGTAYGLGSSFNSTFNQGGGPQTLTQRPKQAVLAAEKKNRQNEAHRQTHLRQKMPDQMKGIRPDLVASAGKPSALDWRSGKYGSDSAQDLGSFMDRAEKENAPAPKPASQSLKERIKNNAVNAGKGAGVTLFKGAFSPAFAIRDGAKGIRDGGRAAVDNVKQASANQSSGKGESK